jgi:hypothetical protein
METIKLNKGDKLHSLENLIVFETGEYNYDDLVLVSDINNSDKPLYQYTAFFIKYGTTNIVY